MGIWVFQFMDAGSDDRICLGVGAARPLRHVDGVLLLLPHPVHTSVVLATSPSRHVARGTVVFEHLHSHLLCCLRQAPTGIDLSFEEGLSLKRIEHWRHR